MLWGLEYGGDCGRGFWSGKQADGPVMVIHKCLILPDQYLKLLFEFGDPCIALLDSPN